MNDTWLDLDWPIYYNIWERLPPQLKRISELVGVQEGFLARAMHNGVRSTTAQQKDKVRIHRRFFTALILHDLVNEEPLAVVSRRYKVQKGLLQSLQNSSATFAGMVTVFCRKLGWNCMEVLLEQFQGRLSFGVCRELCNLVRIPLLNRSTARLFYKHGYESVSAIANSTRDEIAKVLRESTPFHSDKLAGREATVRHIWLTGLEGLTERKASDMIIEEAKRILAADAEALGIPREKLQLPYAVKSKIIKKNSFQKDQGNFKTTRQRKRSSTEKTMNETLAKRFSPDRTKSEGMSPENNDEKQTTNQTQNDYNSVKIEKSILESSDSLVVSDSLLKPPTLSQPSSLAAATSPVTGKVNEKMEYSALELSLRLSTTDEMMEQPIVPPLKLHSQFNAVSSGFNRGTAVKSPEFSANTEEREDLCLSGALFSPPHDGSNNSDDLFESSNVVSHGNLTNAGNRSQGEFLIIDVASSKTLFMTFLQEWSEQENFSLCFSCEISKQMNLSIGKKLRSNNNTAKRSPQGATPPSRLLYTLDDIQATGLAVCWGQKDAYYIDLMERSNNLHHDLDDTSLPPNVAEELSLSFRLKSIQTILNKKCRKEVVAFDMKEQLKVLFEITNCLLPASTLSDPKVAQWLLEPSQREKNLHGIVKEWLSDEFIALTEGWCASHVSHVYFKSLYI